LSVTYPNSTYFLFGDAKFIPVCRLVLSYDCFAVLI
jgi:hypothetical protein